MGHFWVNRTSVASQSQGLRPAVRAHAAGHNKEGRGMNTLKIQVVRVLLALTALAASGLVLEAGRRWS